MEIFNNIMIEPAVTCTLRCPICAVGSGNVNEAEKFLSIDRFEKIIQEVTPFVENVSLYNRGEPFLAPDISKMIKSLSEKKINLTIHTNGQSISESSLLALADFKASVLLVFSLDGPDQESYEYYRKGGSLKTALLNIKKLVKLKQERQFKLRIAWQYLVNKYNENLVDEALKRAKEIGVDQFRIKTLGIGPNNPLREMYLPRTSKFLRGDSINEVCAFLENMPVVLCGGQVVPCCADSKAELVMGNVFEKPLLEIWNSEKYRKFRINYLNNEKCKACAINKKNRYQKIINLEK